MGALDNSRTPYNMIGSASGLKDQFMCSRPNVASACEMRAIYRSAVIRLTDAGCGRGVASASSLERPRPVWTHAARSIALSMAPSLRVAMMRDGVAADNQVLNAAGVELGQHVAEVRIQHVILGW